MANVIEKAREVANDISKKGKMTSRRSKSVVKKSVDNYLEKLSQHVKKVEGRVVNSGDKVPASTRGKFDFSKNPHTAKHGTKL